MPREDTGSNVGRRQFLTGLVAAGAATAMTPAAVRGADEVAQNAPRPPSALPPSAKTAEAETENPRELARVKGIPGSDFMVDVIKTLDIRYCPSNCASSYRALHESLINYGGNKMPEFLTCTHEESGVGMAHGYFKAAGKPLMTLCHGTVGLQHATMAVYNAWCDRVPVIIVGGNELDAAHRPPGVPTIHSAQDVNALVRDFTKWDDTPVSLQHFAQSFVRAYKISTTPPYGPVMISLDAGLQQEPMKNHGGEPPYIPRYVPTAPPQGDSGAVKEAARLLANAQNPVIVADRAARSENGVRLLVELAEILQAQVIDLGGRMNFPNTHYLRRPPTAVGNADVILGLELTDFWATVNAYIDNGEHGVGINTSRIKPETKLISINASELLTKANYQDFQRFQSVDVSMSADAEATLPALIEAVKAAIPNDRKAAIEKRGDAARKAFAEARERTRQAAALAWDASPVSTARLVMETWAQIKDLDWSLVASSGKREQLAASAVADGEVLPLAGRIRWVRRGLRRAGVGWRGARQSRSRPLLGQHPIRRRPDVRAGRAVDRRKAQDPAARRDAQQPRLSPGGHARAAPVQLPQPRGEPRRRHGSDRDQHRKSRHRVSQARGIHGLVGERADQGSGAARCRDQGSGCRGEIRSARAGQCLDPAALGEAYRWVWFAGSGWRRRLPPACSSASSGAVAARSPPRPRRARRPISSTAAGSVTACRPKAASPALSSRRIPSRSRRSPLSCAPPTAPCRPTRRRSCRTTTSRISTPICRRSPSRRITRAFPCSTSSREAEAISVKTILSSPRKRGPIFQSRWLWVPACAGTTASHDQRSSTSRSLLQPAQQIMTLVFEACSSSVRMASRCSGVPEITRCSQAPQMPSSQE